jgi:hypothetical protein
MFFYIRFSRSKLSGQREHKQATRNCHAAPPDIRRPRRRNYLETFKVTPSPVYNRISNYMHCRHNARDKSCVKKDIRSCSRRRANCSTRSRYYEEGRGVEGEFIESWDRIEKFYQEMNFAPASSIRAFVADLRSNGYDKTLRAGQSLYSLIISRSRRHGLRPGQPHIAFQFSESGMGVCVRIDGERTVSFPRIKLDENLDAFLKELESQSID